MSKTIPEIRPFAEADLPILHAIREAAFAPVFRSFRELAGPDIAPILFANAEAGQGEWLDHICDQESSHSVFVALIEGRAVGFCDLSLDEAKRVGTLGLNAVHPDEANEGIGTALYRHVVEEMRKAGMEVAIVDTGGDASHAPARRAYAKAGFCAEIPAVQMSRAL